MKSISTTTKMDNKQEQNGFMGWIQVLSEEAYYMLLTGLSAFKNTYIICKIISIWRAKSIEHNILYAHI